MKTLHQNDLQMMKIHCDNHYGFHCFDFLCLLSTHSQQKMQFLEKLLLASCFSDNKDPNSAGKMSD
ncbi:hypothetical protein HanIR_Chr04g0180281 [Helianthus annuus]|nr:hypothetical protein HanIR_Chr04g0180281 [Helianthus annuus]